MSPDLSQIDYIIKNGLIGGVLTVDAWKRVREVVELAIIWNDAPCSWPMVPEHDPKWGPDLCDGDNHQMECPSERARQDLITALNSLRR